MAHAAEQSPACGLHRSYRTMNTVHDEDLERALDGLLHQVGHTADPLPSGMRREPLRVIWEVHAQVDRDGPALRGATARGAAGGRDRLDCGRGAEQK
jgi:hypothetical protein